MYIHVFGPIKVLLYYVYIVNGKNPKIIMPMGDVMIVCRSSALDLPAQPNFKSVYGGCRYGYELMASAMPGIAIGSPYISNS